MSLRHVSLVVLLALLVTTFASVPTQAAIQAPASTDITSHDVERQALTAPTATGAINLVPIGGYAPTDAIPEIVAYDPATQQLFTSNADAGLIDVVDISDPSNPTRVTTIDELGGGTPNSVAVKDGLVAVAVEDSSNPQANGDVYFFNTDGSAASPASVEVGPMPDMVTFTPDGSYVLTANEGEPNEAYTVDPEGSVSIIDTSSFNETRVGFTDFNVGQSRHSELYDSSIQVNDGTARIYGPSASVAEDLEPEYIAVSPDSTLAYVALQENNAVAIINIASGSVVAVVGLGFKNHFLPENELDASNDDNTINITNWPVYGMYQPDAIATYEVNGNTYIVSANEGDSRDYSGFSEETDVDSIAANSDIQGPNNAGPLGLTDAVVGYVLDDGTPFTGDTDSEEPGFEELYSYGARSFSVWDGSTGELISDTANEFALIHAATVPDYFNADFEDNGTPDPSDDVFEFDGRSDNKGVEPEGIVTGKVGSRTYAFVGLERGQGFMVYDVTNPGDPEFVAYEVATTDFENATGDIAPEGLIFIPASDSPTSRALLISSFEVSGTLRIYEVQRDSKTIYLPQIFNGTTIQDPPEPQPVTLTVLHNNDGESALLPVEEGTSEGNLDVGGVANFASVFEREYTEARNAGNAVMGVYAGDAFLASATFSCTQDDLNGTYFDAVAQRQIPYTAHVIGNHEFDFGPDTLSGFIREFGREQPFLSANLDFSASPDFDDLTDENGLIYGKVEDNRPVARSMVYYDMETATRFGIVAAITPGLENISSPDPVTVTTADLDEVATEVQAEIDRMTGLGVNKIIFVSHLQSITNDTQVINQLTDIDVAIAGGGDELLISDASDAPSENQQRLPGDDTTQQGNYPESATNADGDTVYIVTTPGRYRYLGRLDIEFNAAGEVTSLISGESYLRRVIPTGTSNNTSTKLNSLNVTDDVTPDSAIVSSVVNPVATCVGNLAEPIARTEVVFDTSRAGVRGSETNTGNMITDSYLYILEQTDVQTKNSTNLANIAGEPLIAIQNGGGIRDNLGNTLPADGQVPAGISLFDIQSVLAFANDLTVVEEISPADLKSIFERASHDLPNLDGAFLQVSANVSVEYDLSQTAQVITEAGVVTTPGERVRNLSITVPDGGGGTTTIDIVVNGAVEGTAPNVNIITNSFTAGGGDNYPWLDAASSFDIQDPNAAGPLSYREAWIGYLTDTNVFAELGNPALPTVQDDGTRTPDQFYQPGVNDRITINN